MVASSQIPQKAPGSYSIPPKVDILLIEDDTGSILEVYSSLAEQIPRFLTELEAKQWDYHFATIPLTSDRPLNQIMASKYDGNWGAQWIPPYPGASRDGPGMILPSLFRFPSEYTDFLFPTSSLSGSEAGLEMITSTLSRRIPGTTFLRDDALLVMMVVGNGQDTSRVNICYRNDGNGYEYSAPCDLLNAPACKSISEAGAPGKTCASGNISLDYYQQKLSALRPSKNQIKFFAAVSPYTYSSGTCRGSGAYPGTRYINMASRLNGKSYNICTQTVSSILHDLSSSLQSTKLNMETRYLFIQQEPDVSTIEVTRYVNGNTDNPVIIPRDPENGWTYIGYQEHLYAIDSPIPLNLSSGYALELHGTGKLIGEDSASVKYLPKGIQNSAAP